MASADSHDPGVDRWFEETHHPLEPMLRRAREVILGADDRVSESIKWKTPIDMESTLMVHGERVHAV